MFVIQGTAVAQPSGADGEQAEGDEEVIAFCDDYMAAYLESSGRKLFRALRADHFELKEVGLTGWMMVDIEFPPGEVRRVAFDVFREKSGRVIGLVGSERDYRRTLVVARTERGPVVASHRWPSDDKLETKNDCRPTKSRLLYPQIDGTDVAVEPFKYWGVRVADRLPTDRTYGLADDESEEPSNVYELLKRLLGEEPTDESSTESSDEIRESVEQELQDFDLE